MSLLKILFRYLLVVSFPFANVASYGQQLLNQSQLLEDADFLYAALGANHPSLYQFQSRERSDSIFSKFKQQLNRPMPRLEFLQIVAPFVASFKDGHTGVSIPFLNDLFLEHAKSGGLIFPLRVVKIEESYFVVGDSSLNFPQGAEIVSINGKSISSIMNEIKNLWSADDARTQLLTAQRFFGLSLWLQFGWGNETYVGLKFSEKLFTKRVRGVSVEEFVKRSKKAARRLRIFPDQQLAVLEIQSYSDKKISIDFIDSAFAIINQQQIKNLALDLRANSGGNSVIGDYVLCHITDKPYSTVRSKMWRIGPLVGEVSQNHGAYSMIENAKRTWKTNGNEFFFSPEFSAERMFTFNDSVINTKLNFYLLVSGRTYSSAHMTAVAVKCGKLGKIVGQATGERLDLTGEVFEFEVPNSKIRFTTATATYKAACGKGDQVGVKPDHFIGISKSEFLNNIDSELEFLKRLCSMEATR
jgi:hypothetical protein